MILNLRSGGSDTAQRSGRISHLIICYIILNISHICSYDSFNEWLNIYNKSNEKYTYVLKIRANNHNVLEAYVTRGVD